jgi:DNA-binding transcriptional ArsR family regulator
MRKSDLILHPVRMRIMIELAGRSMSTAALARRLHDVPQASLYRHIKILAEAGLLEPVGERPVNGAIERTYAVARQHGRLSAQDMRGLSAKDHLRYFNIFVANLASEFARYIHSADLSRVLDDGLAYNSAVVYLTDDERMQFRREFEAMAARMLNRQPEPGRRPYALASAVIPGPGEDAA